MKARLEKKIQAALVALQEAGTLPVFDVPEISVARPDPQFGEYTSNIALVLGGVVKKNPMAIAEMLREKLVAEEWERVEVLKPGHINFFLAQQALASVLPKILKEGNDYGNSERGKDIKVNNEFISANPTGPLHLGNARGGFYADCVSRVLRKAGFDVTNEYYINDAGEQILKLGHSVLKDDEAVYAGEYIDALNQRLAQDSRLQSVREAGEWAAEYIVENDIKRTIEEKMHITFDVWTSERKDIIAKGYVDRVIRIFDEKKLTEDKDGAKWLKTASYQDALEAEGMTDDKDRVLIKSDGTKTYFASDCGYLLHKMERGFGRLIETWGADHHSYQFRLYAAAEKLGFVPKNRIDFRFVQLVKLIKDGQEVRMSKRAGNVVTIDELIDAVGYDVARFFFLLYAPETQMRFDLGLAEERSQKNPVFYVQYAHARLASILRKSAEDGFAGNTADISRLVHGKERELLRELFYFPELIEELSQTLRVHQLPQYAVRLADRLHSFYDECRVLDAGDKELTGARLALIRATQIVLKETFDLMGITAPERM